MFNIHDGYNDYLSLSTCKLHVYLLPKSNLFISVPLFWEADMQNLTDHDCFATICFTNSSDELFHQGSCSFIKVVEIWISPPPNKTSKCSETLKGNQTEEASQPCWQEQIHKYTQQFCTQFFILSITNPNTWQWVLSFCVQQCQSESVVK